MSVWTRKELSDQMQHVRAIVPMQFTPILQLYTLNCYGIVQWRN